MLLVALTRTQADTVGKILGILMVAVVKDVIHADTHIYSDYESIRTFPSEDFREMKSLPSSMEYVHIIACLDK
jgi:hypothetical protein